jgi:hypothetical protein
MEAYRIYIAYLMDLLAPTTPEIVRTQREQEFISHMESIALSTQEIIELFNRSTKLWTYMLEDGKYRRYKRKKKV